MINHVNTVLIAKTAPASFSKVDSLADGAIALFDENKKLLTTAANAAAANAIYVGVCQGTEDVYNEKGTKTTKAVIKYSMPIQKGSCPSMVITPFVAKAEDKIVITATNVTPKLVTVMFCVLFIITFTKLRVSLLILMK